MPASLMMRTCLSATPTAGSVSMRRRSQARKVAIVRSQSEGGAESNSATSQADSNAGSGASEQSASQGEAAQQKQASDSASQAQQQQAAASQAGNANDSNMFPSTPPEEVISPVTDAAFWYGPNRPKFMGPLSPPAPKHLDGTMPGDYGWDTACLGTNPETLRRYREAELMNGRWAMLGAVGCVVPELIPQTDYVPWFKAGARIFSEGGINYMGYPGLIHAQSANLTLAVEVVLMGAAEAFRVGGGPLGDPKDKKDPLYPGEYFDPLDLAGDPDEAALLKVKEIKNGRLAMMAMLGFFVQAIVTGEGPIANLREHVNEPYKMNIFHYATKFAPGQ